MNIPEGTDLQDLSIKALMKIIEGAKKHIEDLEKKLKEKDERIKLLCEDWTDDENMIEEMLEPIIGREFIDGNIYCSPGTVGCVEELVKKYNNLKELHTLNFMSDMLPMEKLQKQRDELKERVKMLEDIIAKHTSIPKAVIPMLREFPEIVQSEITGVLEKPKSGCWHSIVNIRVRENGEREIICNNCNEVVEVITPLFPDKDANL
jgi:DNA repair exonuclease SbcCD ATPase subunit